MAGRTDVPQSFNVLSAYARLGHKYKMTHLVQQSLERIKDVKQRLENAKYELEVAQRDGQYELASRLRFSTIPDLEKQLPKDNEAADDSNSPIAMLHDRVTSNDIARVVAKATGIPVQNLMKGEREKLVHVRSK